MRKSVFATVMAAVFAILAMMPAFAGNPDTPTGAPTDPASAMFTLEDIYQRLATGATGTKRVGPFANPTSGPGATGHTLDEVMGKAPAVDAGGASPADVLSGRIFWGLKSGSWGVQTGTAAPASVPKTGDSADGAKGVAIPNPRFTDNGNGTVKDNLTGLIWLKKANCGGMKNWADAQTFANSLYDGWTGDGSGGDCGLSDGSAAGAWRLPNKNELASLLHAGYFNPALSNDAGDAKWGTTGTSSFTNVQSNLYWSATTYVGDTSLAWYMNLNNGFVDYDFKTYTFYVWPVR